MKLAVIAITRNGSALAGMIRDLYPDGAEIYLPKRFINEKGKGVHPLKEDLAGEVGRLFKGYEGLVFVMAAGVVVRLIAPYLKDKRTDPAVLVLDEKGKYVISLLSGHAGGANGLAKMLAKLICASPVITTASDVQGAPAVDTLAGKLGCVMEDFEQAKKVTSAIVNGEPVALYSHGGKKTLKGAFKKRPVNLQLFDSIEGAAGSGCGSAIIITPYLLHKKDLKAFGRAAVLRPRVLVVGMGCNRGTSERELTGLFDRTLKEHGLSPLSVRNIATIEDKRNEAGLISFARKRGLDIEFIKKERLKGAATPSGPSETVFKNMGVYGVCEPAALLSAGAKKLLTAKVKSKNVTIAVAEAGYR